MRMRRLLPMLLAPALLCGCFSFERSSEVLDARILALRAEPPELVAGGPLPPLIELTALVVDPRRDDPAGAFEWRSCVPDLRGVEGPGGEDLSGTDERGLCDEARPETLVLAGDGPWGLLQASVPVPPELAFLAAMAPRELGLSVSLVAQLRVASPEGPLEAIKRVVFSSPVPEGRLPNRNPRLTALLLDDEPWEPGTPRQVRLGDCPAKNRMQLPDLDNPGRMLSRCARRITPVFDEEEAQPYEVVTFDGRVLPLRERLRFAWYVTRGSLTASWTEQPETLGPQLHDPVSTRWVEPAERTERMTLWVVIRDGRGGAAWEKRELVFE